jgi:hypothetical protein
MVFHVLRQNGASFSRGWFEVGVINACRLGLATRLKRKRESRLSARLSRFNHVFKSGLKRSEASSIEENTREQGAETRSVLLQSRPAAL